MLSPYAAGKAALRSIARGLARELLPRKIRVNAVSPGPIDSGAPERALPPELADQVVAQFIAATPMQRRGTPAEVVKAMLFLAFDATYTTGAELVVDGGTSQL
jgi:NAD(P)-dependent dehydrogenase (short-subunit alcohol dehydrogenase family)